MSFLSDYTEKNSNLIPKIDIPCFAWNSQAEQGFLFFKAKSLIRQSFYFSRYILIHEYKMADASSHDKQMKYFMGAKLTVLRVEHRQF